MENQVMQIVSDALVEILKVLIVGLGGIAIAYVNVKKNELIAKIGQDKYEANKSLALDLVRIIEERFRLGELVGSKAEEFERLILAKAPTLSAEQLKDLKDLAVRTFDEEIGKYNK